MEINETFLENLHDFFEWTTAHTEVLKVGEKIEGQKINVKLKIMGDYYIADENFKVVDINFNEKTINVLLDLEETAKFFNWT
jgi:hypothetical protein